MAHTHQKEVDDNFDAFVKLLPELLKLHPGKYALMHNGEVIEFFDTISDAVRYGHAKFGDMNFSIQEVTTQGINLGYHSYALHQSAP
jgi:uncharacterized protein DUF5678